MRILFSIVALALVCCKPSYQQKSITTEIEPMGDNSRTSLDWPGTYHGTLPCADCKGIKTEIILEQDNEYTIRQQYEGKSDSVFVDTGVMTWDKLGGVITFEHDEMSFQVGENVLSLLDKEGNLITGDLADNYKLNKEKQVITEKHWVLIELNGEPIVSDENRKRELYFTLKLNDNRVIGHGGCNSFFSYYKLGPDNSLQFEKMVSTRMACNDNNLESRYLQVLSECKSFQQKGNILYLNGVKEVSAKFMSVYFY